jgi:hypothetical protein
MRIEARGVCRTAVCGRKGRRAGLNRNDRNIRKGKRTGGKGIAGDANQARRETAAESCTKEKTTPANPNPVDSCPILISASARRAA